MHLQKHWQRVLQLSQVFVVASYAQRQRQRQTVGAEDIVIVHPRDLEHHGLELAVFRAFAP